MFSVPQKSPAITIFPPVGNCFVSATVLTIFHHLFSSTLLLYYSFQFSNRYAIHVEAKPFLSTSVQSYSNLRHPIVNCCEIHHVKNTEIGWWLRELNFPLALLLFCSLTVNFSTIVTPRIASLPEDFITWLSIWSNNWSFCWFLFRELWIDGNNLTFGGICLEPFTPRSH